MKRQTEAILNLKRVFFYQRGSSANLMKIIMANFNYLFPVKISKETNERSNSAKGKQEKEDRRTS